MAASSPQGSRGGLITAVVIFTILFVTATIFAIYYAVALGKAEDLATLKDARNAKIYGDITSSRFVELQTQATSPTEHNLRDRTVVGAAIANNEALEHRILGENIPSAQATQSALSAADTALAQIPTALPGAVINNSNLVQAVSDLIKYSQSQGKIAADARSGQSQNATDAAKKIADLQTQVDAAKENAQKALDDATASRNAIAAAQAALDQKLTDSNSTIDKERAQFNAALKAAELRQHELESEIAGLNKTKDALAQKLSQFRPSGEDAVVRRSDGHILTVASDSVVYIDLGQGDHISPGMTFEVYNRRDGIPKLGDGLSDTDMPVGEASIEVTQILGTSSQCRVSKLEPGQHITEGDLIANLVYDRNTKYNFVVYGKFDLAQTGQPNVKDADYVQALVVNWGGKLQDKINVDTDFVIMGAEPKVDDLDPNTTDAFALARYHQQLADQKAYNDVVGQAKDLHIPIMNQNRFLYYVGYYDLASRSQ